MVTSSHVPPAQRILFLLHPQIVPLLRCDRIPSDSGSESATESWEVSEEEREDESEEKSEVS